MRKCLDVMISELLHNDSRAYVQSGYGGKRIELWPFYTFMKMWVDGDHLHSRDLWIDWLVNEFYKNGFMRKSDGGMYQGSVHRYTLNYVSKSKSEAWQNPALIKEAHLRQGAASLVDKRIEMIRSVMEMGYREELADPIFAVRTGSYYVLKGGHHRAAIMHILGYDKLPCVIIYSKVSWRCKKWLVAIKRSIGSTLRLNTRNG